MNDNQIQILINGMREASAIVLSHYRKVGLDIRNKEDQSPVTEADIASHQFFAGFLAREFPGIPLISEEAVSLPYEQRKDWEYVWILDPLDGTKEFIAANDEFAINLALIHWDRPVAGFIAIPAKDHIYYGIKGGGSWRVEPDGTKQKLPVYTTEHQKTQTIKALISRSHAGVAEKEYLKRIADLGWTVDTVPAGSAYKHVLLAEGSAHLYAKPGKCWEWDTAPGQIILEEAGGSVVRMEDGQPLIYNKESFLNPDLVMWAPGVSIAL